VGARLCLRERRRKRREKRKRRKEIFIDEPRGHRPEPSVRESPRDAAIPAQGTREEAVVEDR
jgi:hypothetical protein